ncbi:PKD domain-containing protein [Candidatus Marithrix sp. Canyon 246]|uniref:PKD domain-containing protein n=1 Tax=Candidatus Marithrix sp. Canyon 246 TaxID=1827136 RepID=UPI00084A21CC|nr:PKD domain-containing protein [Candidatus Marithrix sp. Canyon 246]
MRLSIILWLICLSAFADDSIKTFNGHENGVKSIAISNSGQLAISASKDQTVKVWDINSGTELRTCYGHNNDVTSISFSPDGNQAISGDLDGTIILWDINTCQVLHNFSNESEVKSVAWSPNNAYILSAHDNNMVKLWDTNTKQEIRTFIGHTDQISDVSFSPDSSKALSTSKDTTIKLWDVATGQEIRTFTGHTKWVVSAAFSSDGVFVISSSWDNTIRRWNIQTGTHRVYSDQTWVLDVSFFLDSNYALSGGKDQTLKLWDLNAGKSLCTLKGHKGTITSVAVSKTSNILLSGSSDKTLKQWQACKIPPKADFSYSKKSMTVTLDASASKAVNGNIIEYKWSTSDGQTGSGVTTSLTFQATGNYIITLTVTDSNGMTSQLQKQVDLNPDQLGKAIIIAAGGAQRGNTLFPYSNDYVQRMYNLVKQRGLTDSDVYYMNPQAPDLDDDGFQEDHLQDFNLFDPETDINKAFTEAAKNLKAGQQLIFYIHGHSRKDSFNITPNYELSAAKLKELLDLIPAGVQQLIFIDTCYSGSFLNELAGVENRIVITSTDDNSLTWQVTEMSFADKLLTQLQKGESLGGAFTFAKQFILNNTKYFSGQTPWLDDNSDGQYVDDGRLAEKVFLVKGGIHGAPPPELEVHPRIVLKDQQISTTIWTKVTSPTHDKIRKVRAILVRPNLVNAEYNGMETDFDREEIELIYNAAQNRYEIVYDKFFINGVWNIIYQAKDTDGFWSDVKMAEVEINNVPEKFIKLFLNKSSYKPASEQNLTVDVYSKDPIQAKMYLGMILPNGGGVKTLIHPYEKFGKANQINPYIRKLKINQPKTYYIKSLVPKKAAAAVSGYMFCGVLVPAAEDIKMDGSNWLALDCTGFKVQ